MSEGGQPGPKESFLFDSQPGHTRDPYRHIHDQIEIPVFSKETQNPEYQNSVEADSVCSKHWPGLWPSHHRSFICHFLNDKHF